MKNKTVHEIVFKNNLKLQFTDESNRYFGDFHRLLIEVDALIETGAKPMRLRYQRPLKKMGVATEDLANERSLLIEQFLATVEPYMQRDDFVPKLLETIEKSDQKIWKQLP